MNNSSAAQALNSVDQHYRTFAFSLSLHILGGGRRLTTMSGAHIIRLLRVPSFDTMPFLFHAKIGASLPDPAVENDVLVVRGHRTGKLFNRSSLAYIFSGAAQELQ